MDFTPDPKIDLTDAVVVTLAGRSFHVPVLPLRQTIKIAALAPKLGRYAEGDVTEEQMLDIATIVHVALTRAYPTLTFEAFLDLPITFEDLWRAAPIILRQTRALAEAQPGEVLAASRSIG
ncbi:MAG TPA: hypothetical protein VG271_19710 [Beijerinckiaceae bacterium]|nr:hypothetical protein [Beijerinckiaceae bacterium]